MAKGEINDPCRCGRNGYHRGKDNHCKVCGKVRTGASGKPTAGTLLKKVQRGPFNHPDRDVRRPEHRNGPVVSVRAPFDGTSPRTRNSE